MTDDSVAESAAGRPSIEDAPQVPDEVLLRAADAARAALYEITPPETVGAPAGHIVEGERVLSLLFENRLPGYPGWYWTVSLSREPDSSEANVLEAELMPGEKALLAPDWVPWADRLAEYQAQKRAEREAAAAAGEPEPEDDFVAVDEDEDDEDDLEADDDEADDAAHAGVAAEDQDEEDLDDDLEVADLQDFDDEDDAEADDFESDELQGAEEAALSSDEEE